MLEEGVAEGWAGAGAVFSKCAEKFSYVPTYKLYKLNFSNKLDINSISTGLSLL